MATWNTPHSKTKPFWEIAVTLGPNPFENYSNPLRNHLTIASQRLAVSPASPSSDARLYRLSGLLDLSFCFSCRAIDRTMPDVNHRLEKVRERLARRGLFMNEPEPVIICRACRFALGDSPTAVAIAEKHDVPKSTTKELTRL